MLLCVVFKSVLQKSPLSKCRGGKKVIDLETIEMETIQMVR